MKYQFKISSGAIESIPVIIIEGDLTSDADSEVKNVYSRLKESFKMDRLIINFEKTKYINSSGIATLINIIQDSNERKGKIHFVGMSEHLHKVMDIVGISDFVQVHKTNQEAAASL
ncbi:MAG TPA: STAS domain-containing protein [Spirochaetota bacterium]|nr:STAS domain-containing protein [Spirochaetota bacterium]HRZ26222.1 STAS domain-containing protein [Spirochaetota bacterium]HSA14646.1 STAS domain-containing protein [Spirochaetota bacterium]